MLCEVCQQNQASVHLTQVVDGAVKKLHLCESCARESGVDLQNPVSIADLLLGLGQAAGSEEKSDKSCPACHMKQSDFRKTGRLGCPLCYEAFSEELGPLIRAMHRRDQHVGRIPKGQAVRIRRAAELNRLQKAMDEAVAREDFEEAARLRDQVQRLRRDPTGGEAAAGGGAGT